MTLDDWLSLIPEDERSMITLPEVWNAAIQATIDALLEAGNISHDYQESWEMTVAAIKEGDD